MGNAADPEIVSLASLAAAAGAPSWVVKRMARTGRLGFPASRLNQVWAVTKANIPAARKALTRIAAAHKARKTADLVLRGGSVADA